MSRRRFSSRPGLLCRLALLGLALVGVPLLPAQDKAKDAAGVIYPRGSELHPEAAAASGPGYAGLLTAAALLAGAGGWLVWRSRGVRGGPLVARRLAVTETKSLGNRQFLVVASYEDRKFLLGVCPGRIELLTPLDGNPAPKLQ